VARTRSGGGHPSGVRIPSGCTSSGRRAAKPGSFACRRAVDRRLPSRRGPWRGPSPGWEDFGVPGAVAREPETESLDGQPAEGQRRLYEPVPIETSSFANIPLLAFAPDGKKILSMLTVKPDTAYRLLRGRRVPAVGSLRKPNVPLGVRPARGCRTRGTWYFRRDSWESGTPRAAATGRSPSGTSRCSIHGFTGRVAGGLSIQLSHVDVIAVPWTEVPSGRCWEACGPSRSRRLRRLRRRWFT